MSGSGWMTWLVIAAGSAAGGIARQATTEAVTRLAGGGFPWGTLTVNLVGSLAIGILAALAAATSPSAWTPVIRHATVTGFLGGFTTFSTFSVQTFALLQQGSWGAAAANAVMSVVVGVLACGAGYALTAAALR
jgi:fluoride exporter